MPNSQVSFTKALQWVLSHEGGLSTSSADKGGTTKYGISKAAYPTVDITTLTIMEAQTIYERDYWIPSRAAEITHQRIASKYFDICVNFGLIEGCKTLQFFVNYFKPNLLQPNGIINDATITAVNALIEARRSDVLTLTQCLGGVQFMRYYQIVQRRPDQAVFSFGWLRRAFDIPPG